MAGDEPVQGVDEASGTKRSKEASERTGEPDLGEKSHAASRVAGNRRPIAEDEPPAFIPRMLGHRGE